jgi:D-glycero-alpha-D-manno-heptose 1-phosphate guanylyltransferase
MIKNVQSNISILGSLQDNCDRYGTLSIIEDKIVDFNEKQMGIKNSYINAGCYFFKDLNFFNNIKDEKFSIEDKFKEYLLNDKIDVFRYNGVFIDIGIPEDYEKMIYYMERLNSDSR